MRTKITETPVEISQTGTTHIDDYPLELNEEIIYERLVELNEELKRMNERLDEITGETE